MCQSCEMKSQVPSLIQATICSATLCQSIYFLLEDFCIQLFWNNYVAWIFCLYSELNGCIMPYCEVEFEHLNILTIVKQIILLAFINYTHPSSSSVQCTSTITASSVLLWKPCKNVWTFKETLQESTTNLKDCLVSGKWFWLVSQTCRDSVCLCPFLS